MNGPDLRNSRSEADGNLEELRSVFQASSGPEQLRLGLELERVLAGHGAYEEAIAVLEPLLGMAAAEDDRARVLQRLGQAHMRLSRYQKAYLYLGEALTILSARPGSPELFQVYHDLAWMYYRQGYLDNARSYLDGTRMALEGLAGSDTSRQHVELLHLTALVEAAAGNHDLAAGNLQMEAGCHRKAGDDRRLAAVYNKLSSVTYTRGDIIGALEYQDLTHTLCGKTGDSFRLALSHKNYGDIYFIMGDYEAALDHFRRSDEICRSIGNGLGQVFALGAMGRILAARGENPEAKNKMDRSLEMARELDSRDREACILVDLADWHCLQSRPEAAIESLKLAGNIEMMRGQAPSPRHRTVLARTLLLMEGMHGALEAQHLMEALVSKAIKLDDEQMTTVPELEAEARLLLGSSFLKQGLKDRAPSEIFRAAALVKEMAEKIPQESRRLFLSKSTNAGILGFTI